MQTPVSVTGTPVEVGITMYVLSISSLSEVQMVLPPPFCFYSHLLFSLLPYPIAVLFVYKLCVLDQCTLSISLSLTRQISHVCCTMGSIAEGPPSIAGPPVVVGVTMYVLSISSLSEVKMVPTFTLFIFSTTFTVMFNIFFYTPAKWIPFISKSTVML